MSQKPPSNVKIYDRPDRPVVSPMIIALIVIALLALSFFGYRAYTNYTSSAASTRSEAPAAMDTGTNAGQTGTTR